MWPWAASLLPVAVALVFAQTAATAPAPWQRSLLQPPVQPPQPPQVWHGLFRARGAARAAAACLVRAARCNTRAQQLRAPSARAASPQPPTRTPGHAVGHQRHHQRRQRRQAGDRQGRRRAGAAGAATGQQRQQHEHGRPASAATDAQGALRGRRSAGLSATGAADGVLGGYCGARDAAAAQLQKRPRQPMHRPDSCTRACACADNGRAQACGCMHMLHGFCMARHHARLLTRPCARSM